MLDDERQPITSFSRKLRSTNLGHGEGESGGVGVEGGHTLSKRNGILCTKPQSVTYMHRARSTRLVLVSS